MTNTFDLIVVGTGSGLDVANWAVQNGWRVAIVEKGPAGGTCLNRGCIPSKMLIHSADVARTIRDAHRFGIHSKGLEVDFPALMKRVRDHVDGDSRNITEGLRQSANPRYFEGAARFTGPRTLRVNGEEIAGERIVLATGARPKIPEVEGLRDVPYITSTEALKLDHLPESMVILGGGYIAAELGHFYGALGTRITIVQKDDRMLTKEDDDVSYAFTRAFSRDHDVMLDAKAKRVSKQADGIRVEVESKERGRVTLDAEQLLVAIGIEPNSDTLDLDKAGVETDKRGYIKADLTLRTNVPHIWSFGDAIGRFPFKHNANHEARYLVENLRDPHNARKVDYHAMPHAVFSHPQVASVGCTEQELQKCGVPHRIARHDYKDTGMGAALAEEEGFVKFLVEPETDRILGCHILGPDAATLIHEVLVAMRSGSNTLGDVAETIHIHPALSEVVQRAASG